MAQLALAADRAAARSFWLGVAAYVLPTFPLAVVWHLSLFAHAYDALAIYRPDKIFAFGLAAMLIQGAALSYIYPRLFGSEERANWLRNGLIFAAGFGVLFWTFTTVAVAAKHVMSSVPTYLALETGFTVLQALVTGPLIALAHRR
jgi:hypothetical protein